MNCPNCNTSMYSEGGNPKNYDCSNCNLQATWRRDEGLIVTWDPNSGDVPRHVTAMDDEPPIRGYSVSGKVPKIDVGPVTCSECHHNAHEPGQCDRCNCGESEIRHP